MNPIERRVTALETSQPSRPPVVRFFRGYGDNVIPENPPSHTEDGRKIIYVSWKKTQSEDQLARKTP